MILVIAYTQIPVWTLVAIAVLYGIVWEIFDAYRRATRPQLPAEYYAGAQSGLMQSMDKVKRN